MRVLLVLAAGILTGCGAKSPHANERVLDEAIREYVSLAVGLGERDANSLDYYYGPAEWVADVRAHPPALDEIKRRANALAAQLQRSPADPPRVQDLIKQLQAIAMRADIVSGARPAFDAEANALFGISLPLETHRKDLDGIRALIAELLPGKGSLASRYGAFDEKFVIPASRVEAVMARAIEGCRERSRQYLALPEGENVRVEYVHNKAWNAYSFYQGSYRSLIQINADFDLTVDRALQLACHEGYPGHHVYNSLRELELVRRGHRDELMVLPTFSPQSLTSEALAIYAVELAFPGNERLQFERDVLFPLAGLNAGDADKYLRIERMVDQLAGRQTDIARDYLNGSLEYVRAAAALEEKALMAHTDATLKYINKYRTYMLTYTVGKDLVESCFARRANVEKAAADQWALFERLATVRTPLDECAR